MFKPYFSWKLYLKKKSTTIFTDLLLSSFFRFCVQCKMSCKKWLLFKHNHSARVRLTVRNTSTTALRESLTHWPLAFYTIPALFFPLPYRLKMVPDRSGSARDQNLRLKEVLKPPAQTPRRFHTEPTFTHRLCTFKAKAYKYIIYYVNVCLDNQLNDILQYSACMALLY